MTALRIPDGFEYDLLNRELIIACTYKLVRGGEADCVAMEYRDRFPDWEVVEVEQPDGDMV